jgi:hypothetical protein
MAKKWYEYIVSVEKPEHAPPDSADAAQAVADIAAAIQAPPPVQQQQQTQMTQAMAKSAAPLGMAEIYAAADIPAPASGYTILKVAEMLQSPHIKDLPAEVKKSSILVALDAAGVKVQQLVEDAVRRDKALDTFERLQQKQVEEFEATKLDENRKHQAELDKLVADLKAKIEANQKAVTQRREAFQAWRIQKQLEEQRIADTVGHFVTENPISTSR